jgi:hypothetical protein
MIHQVIVNPCEEFRATQRYLEVGKSFAAYFYLPRNPGEKSVGTEKAGAGILIMANPAARLELKLPIQTKSTGAPSMKF